MQTSIVLEQWAVETLKTAALWPVWWYTKGLARVGGMVLDAAKHFGKTLNVRVWLKNIFVPMYGLRDWQSRLISILVRIVIIIAKSFALFVWIGVLAIGFVLYLVFPPALIFLMIWQFL